MVGALSASLGLFLVLQAGIMGNTIYVSPITEVGSELEADHLLGYSSGFLALNFAISICESVDMYGFSVEPGTQSSWFSSHHAS